MPEETALAAAECVVGLLMFDALLDTEAFGMATDNGVLRPPPCLRESAFASALP